MIRRLLTLAALTCSTAACASDASAPWALEVGALESPAGGGSGEPFLSSDGDVVYLSWLEAASGGGHDLRFSSWDGHAWNEAATVAHSERFFVNWADFPSINTGPDGRLWAHWLERGPEGGYDYGVRVVHSGDGGRHWSEPWTPHDDTSPTEHGFMSAFPVADAMGFIWLDGRKHAPGPNGEPATGEMTLRYRSVAPGGAPGPETLIDGRVCDCCQTDAAITSSGPIAVYRNRSDEEIRDIYVTRLESGVWTEGEPVYSDDWTIAGCPVNGPSVAARGDDVAVAWFTAAGDVPLVKVALSSDAGRTFGPPIGVDGGNPAGRVDALMLADGSVLVSWLERTGGERAEVRVRRIGPDGTAGASATLTESSSERASGFPRMVQAPDGSIVVAWTDLIGDEPRVRLQRLEMEE